MRTNKVNFSFYFNLRLALANKGKKNNKIRFKFQTKIKTDFLQVIMHKVNYMITKIAIKSKIILKIKDLIMSYKIKIIILI